MRHEPTDATAIAKLPGVTRTRQSGMTLVELMVSMVAGAIVLAGAYRLWQTHRSESLALERKIDLRNHMTLSSKRIQRSVTLAGLGLGGAASLAKEDAIGTDTLIIFTNPSEVKSALLSDVQAGTGTVIQVESPGLFSGAAYVALSSDGSGEVRKILGRTGGILQVDAPFTRAYPRSASVAFPAVRERYYSDQEGRALIHEGKGGSSIVAKDVRNFQVSFRNMHGESTDLPREVRTVQFSFTGIFPAKPGALNSLIFSSTAIPRNTL